MSSQSINVTDGRTDGQTTCDCKTALRGKQGVSLFWTNL